MIPTRLSIFPSTIRPVGSSSVEGASASPRPLFSVPWEECAASLLVSGFATVRNHLATQQLLDFMGSDLFVYHGFVEFYLERKWVKATPAFNRELCWRHGVDPLEFNGREDALFQPFNSRNEKFMDYLEYTGTYADIPVSAIVEGWEEAYGKDRVRRWIRMFEERGGISLGDFEREDVRDEG